MSPTPIEASTTEREAALQAQVERRREALGTILTELDGLNYASGQDDGPAIIAVRAILKEQDAGASHD